VKDHKSIQSLIARAEAWAQEELRAQRAMLTTLRRQEEALLAGNANVLEECGAEIGTVMAAGPERARHRDRLMAALAGAMDLKGDEVRLSIIAERGGADGKRLGRLRNELREAAAEVLTLVRRIGRLATYHQSLLNEIVRAVAGDPSPAGTPLQRGSLVDAEV